MRKGNTLGFLCMIKLLKDKTAFIKTPVGINIGWQSASSISRMFFSITSSVLLTRYLGPDSYGQYSFILAIIGILSLLAYGGSYNTAIKLLQDYKNQTNQVLCAVLIWRYICWFITFLLLIPFLLISSGIKSDIILLIFISFLFNPADVLESYFRSIYQNKYFIICRISTEAFALAIKIACVYLHYDLIVFFWIIAGQNMAYAFCLITVFVVTQKKQIVFSINQTILAKLVKESLPMVITLFVFGLYTRIDQLMISNLYGNEELGFFAPSAQIVMAIASLTVAVTQPMQVKFKDIGKSHDNYIKWIGEYFNIAARISYVVSIVICASAWFIVPLLFGSEFKATIPILMIQIWACVFSFQGAIRDMESINHYATIYNLICACVGLASNIILNYVLIPLYGGIGAAIATIFSLFISCHLINWLIQDLRPYAKLQLGALLLWPIKK